MKAPAVNTGNTRDDENVVVSMTGRRQCGLSAATTRPYARVILFPLTGTGRPGCWEMPPFRKSAGFLSLKTPFPHKWVAESELYGPVNVLVQMGLL